MAMSEDDATLYLREVGRADDAAIDLGEAALHLASFRRPRVPLARYREHLAALAGDVAAALGPEPEAPAAALARRVEALKAALIQNDQIAEAVAVIEQMQLFAPAEIGLWREAGLCHARLDNLGAAIAALETFIAGSPGDSHRHECAALLAQIRRRLN